MKKLTKLFVIVLNLILLSSVCHAKQERLIQGRTMGTTYHIKVVGTDFSGLAGLADKIEKRLAEINQSMSTYIKDSEISRFNDFNRVGAKFKISHDFFSVMKKAATVYSLSAGAWDGTVGPLVNLWGFGRKGRKDAIPPKTTIKALIADVGFGNIQLIEPGYMLKKHAAVTLDLGSIAKGFAVDALASIVREDGFKDFLVEIGGEVYASGLRVDSTKWRIGINRPRKNATPNDVYKIVELQNKAFATSGDYRNFFEIDGIRYSHVINPKTGWPVANGVVSVSLLADDCTFADGLATAIMVMGHQTGLELINRLAGVEGLIIVENSDGRLVDYYSNGFKSIKN
jgi:thiamine biosynthesis lipoprotein